MFHSDISFSQNEKAIQFSEDAKTFFNSYKDALKYVRDLAFADDQKENYSNFAKELIVNYKNGLINKTRLLDSEKAYMSPFTPTFTKNDEKFKLAKFVVNFFSKYENDLKQAKEFQSFDEKLDKLYEHVEKEIKI